MKEKNGHTERKSRGDAAVALMEAGGNCAQAVLTAFAGAAGLDRVAALKIASGFGAGLARRQEVCGAVTGAVMVIGMIHGQERPDDLAAKEKAYALTRELCERFRAEFGSCLCRELLQVDLLTDAGQQQYRERNLGERVCHPCVRGAVRILDAIL
jgi:C_GCAxxG_C_C family probable redox protein